MKPKTLNKTNAPVVHILVNSDGLRDSHNIKWRNKDNNNSIHQKIDVPSVKGRGKLESAYTWRSTSKFVFVDLCRC